MVHSASEGSLLCQLSYNHKISRGLRKLDIEKISRAPDLASP
jgi:hypothetical protein